MTLKERRVGDVTILHLTGRLVLDDGHDELRHKIDELADQERVSLIVDLKDVTYIDSCGVGLLIAKYVSLRRKRGDVKLLNLTARSHHLMEISKLLDVFETFESEDHALASFTREAQA
ncbi:MAG: STAS domain-containing protein [Acidobacteria bacterium]|nr:STAS domain-containing protein [Acidobacteriota bacterium]